MTAPVPLDFRDASSLVVEKFLHSVVVVDDRATYDVGLPDPITNDLAQEGEVDASDVRSRSRRTSRGLITPDAAQRRAEDLDAKSLVDAFAEKGLVCAVLRPAPTEDPEDRAIKSAAQSDIVILDWNIRNADEGETTWAIVRGILTSDKGENRLRLIAVYTGERDIKKISRILRQKLTAMSPTPRLRRDGDFAMTKGSVRMAVFAKEGTRIPTRDTNARSRIVTEADLPQELIMEFVALTAGLVPNVALRSLAAIRGNTHRLLGRFTPSLDPAYLWHRAIQARPADAEDHLVGLVSSEIRSVLDDQQVGNEASLQAIKLWLAQDSVPDYGSRFGEIEARSGSDVLEMLTFGTAGETDASKAAIAKFKKMKRDAGPHKKMDGYTGFASTVAEATRSNEQLAELMSLKTHYTHPLPELQLGTILSKKGKKKSYWLCVQPRCDSVRLGGLRAFPLLPLTIAGATEKFSIILPTHKGTPIKLAVSKRPYEMRMVQFGPTTATSDSVIAKPEGSGFRFRSKSCWYNWVADLKEEHAQRVIDELAYQFGRVGLTESEWLLLWSSK
jgi:hypothetical protein